MISMDLSTKQHRITDWFSRWRSPLRKFLGVRGAIPAADLDDAAQEVFLRLLRYDRAEIVENPQAYLFKMASNVASEWIIRPRHRYPHQPEWLRGLLDEGQPDEDLARREVERQIQRAINRLPIRQRQIITLRFSEGLDQPGIAARLRVSERVIKRDLAKSYSRLRMELSPDLLGVLAHGRE